MTDGSTTSNGIRRGITEPAHLGDERTVLLGYLQRQRELVCWKVGRASDDVLRSVTTPTGLTLHGLVRHLEHVERSWIRDTFAGENDLPYAWAEDDPDGELHVPADITMERLVSDYQAEAARCDTVVAAAASLDAIAVRERFSLRWILLHLIEETARHLGHLDLLRELADGQTGEEPIRGSRHQSRHETVRHQAEDVKQ